MILICEDCGTGYRPISDEIPRKCKDCGGELVEQEEENEEDEKQKE